LKRKRNKESAVSNWEALLLAILTHDEQMSWRVGGGPPQAEEIGRRNEDNYGNWYQPALPEKRMVADIDRRKDMLLLQLHHKKVMHDN
jgi:hypothetical protein